jgi:NTE family protein
LQSSILDSFFSPPGGLDYSFGLNLISEMTKYFTPYDFDSNDMDASHHMKGSLLELIYFDELRKSKVPVFVSATNVLTSKPKIFNFSEITVDTLLASAIVPLLYKAVKIDEEFYWDGILLCNPKINSLIEFTDAKDILIVKVSPTEIDTVPKTTYKIGGRIVQISLHSSFLAEMRLLNFKNEMVDLGFDLDGKLRKIYYHQISADYVLYFFCISLQTILYSLSC